MGSHRGLVLHLTYNPFQPFSKRQGSWWSDPRLLKLAIVTWNVSSRMVKGPELVREVERYRLDIVSLTSGSGHGLLERGCSILELSQVWA